MQKIVHWRVIGRGAMHSVVRNLLYSLNSVKKANDCLLALGPSRCGVLVGVSPGLSSGCKVLACQRSRCSQCHSNEGQDCRADGGSIHVDDSRPDAVRAERTGIGISGRCGRGVDLAMADIWSPRPLDGSLRCRWLGAAVGAFPRSRSSLPLTGHDARFGCR